MIAKDELTHLFLLLNLMERTFFFNVVWGGVLRTFLVSNENEIEKSRMKEVCGMCCELNYYWYGENQNRVRKQIPGKIEQQLTYIESYVLCG